MTPCGRCPYCKLQVELTRKGYIRSHYLLMRGNQIVGRHRGLQPPAGGYVQGCSGTGRRPVPDGELPRLPDLRCAICGNAPTVTSTIGPMDFDGRWVCGLRCRLEQIHGRKLHDEGAGL